MKIYILIILSLLSTNAFTWGATGHRVVGHIAEQNLSTKVYKKINKLLNGESLSRVANWPDKIKSDPINFSHTYPWHYTDWPTNQKQYKPSKKSGILIQAISDQLLLLKNNKSTDAQKSFAIKFITHLVGDLHMPLHVGNGKDRGGNFCKVVFHNKETNLHRLWDEDLINFTKLSYTELSEYVVSAAKISKPNVKGNILDWALESKIIRPSVYPNPVNKKHKNTHSNRKYCHKSSPTQSKLPKIGYDYSYVYLPVIEKRLYQAGKRLALLLNDSF